MINILQKEALEGYDHQLESARQARFDEFMTANDIEAKQDAFQSLAHLTALRSPTFVASYERALGLHNDK